MKPPAARWPLYLGIILAIWLSYLLYIETLSLPYLQEDSTHIRWLSWHNPIEPFLSAKGAPAYRPLGKSIIKIWYLLLDEHDRVWLRFHNIVFNVLNITLLAVLATWVDRSKRRYWTGGIAAILFATFPFAYQAIPWINNFFYPLANLLLLGMTAVYWQARVRRSNWLLLLSFFLLFLAPFEIEYGLMGSGLIFTVEIVLWLQKRQPYPWLTGVLLGLLVNVLFLVRWFTIPKQSYNFGLPTPGRLLLISTYFLQGLMYPISPAAKWLMNILGSGDVLAIWLVSLPVLVTMIAVMLKKRQAALLLFSLFWFLLLNLPALVFVDFDYVVNSPRLLYPPGVGIVIFWGGFLAILAIGHRKAVLRRVLTGVFLIVIITVSVSFVLDRNFYYKLAEKPILQLAEIARETPEENSLLIVNFPSWLSPQARTFAMGNHGVQIIPFYINIQELIYAHNDADHKAEAVQFGNIRQPQPYYYGMLGEQMDYPKMGASLRRNDEVYLTVWAADNLDLQHVGRVLDEPGITGPNVFTFADGTNIAVVDYEVFDDQIELTLEWHIQPGEDDLTAFVHLYGPDGQLISQDDGYPLAGLAPFWLWSDPQTLQDRRQLSWPTASPPGKYQVGVGLYNASSGERISVVDSSGVNQPDDVARLLEIER